MSGTWPKVIRDPVHDLIAFGDNDLDRLLLRLINTKEFQRLRRIKQLGFSDMVFPGATHTRFAHSIGVMHTARKFFKAIRRICPEGAQKEEEILCMCAALLHDVGHGPFSHAFEKVTEDNHEQRTIEIILSETTEVNEVLTEFDAELPQKIVPFFDDTNLADTDIPPWLGGIISSQFDADRGDYLQRDCHGTGVAYGNFDLNWLIGQLELTDEDVEGEDDEKDGPSQRHLCFSNKALYPLEIYAFARAHMYQTVYFHKTTRAAEAMLRALFRKYRHILNGGGNVENVPPQFEAAFEGTELNLETYLQLDDTAAWTFFRACAESRDQDLKTLGSGLLHRKLFKCNDVTGMEYSGISGLEKAIRTTLEEGELDSTCYFLQDFSSDLPYKPYSPQRDNLSKAILIRDSLGKVQELSILSEPVHTLTKRKDMTRFYLPEEKRNLFVKPR